MSETVIVTFATTNIAKYCSIKKNLDSIIPRVDLRLEQIHVDNAAEEGVTSEIENAREKQKKYSLLLDTLVLTTDEGLYLEGATDSYQPGAKIQRVLELIKSQEGSSIQDDIFKYLTKYGTRCMLRKVYCIGKGLDSKIIIAEIPCILKKIEEGMYIDKQRPLNAYMYPVGFNNCISKMSKEELERYHKKYLKNQMQEIANYAYSFV